MDQPASVPVLPDAGSPELPMHELLALEAVSRLGAVQAAAEALHVTPSGVSHRIASLERRLGQPLLRRSGRGVALTALAEEVVASVRPGLVALSGFTATLQARERALIRVATAAAIGVSWLLPRIQRYRAQRPEARFELLTLATSDELPQDQWDLLIHYAEGDGRAPGRGVAHSVLFDEQLLQVRAPQRPARGRARSAAGAEPALQLRLAQLDLPARRGGRRRAAEAAPARLVFDDALAMLEAAAAGAGTALATATAAQPYLDDGRLERADAEAIAGGRYAIDLSEAGRLKPLAADFYRWVVQTAG